MIRRLANELADLIEKKNSQYGNSYDKTREEYGEIIFLVRITDKLNRLKALCSKGLSSEIEESIEDTIKDIAGYCLLELAYRRRGRI